MVSVLSGFLGSPLVHGHNFLQVRHGSPNVFSSPRLKPCGFSALNNLEASPIALKQGGTLLENVLEKSPVFCNVKIQIEGSAVQTKNLGLGVKSTNPCGIRRNSCIPSIRSSVEIPQPVEDEGHLELHRVIGRGGFGRVYLGVVNNHRVAVKKLHGQTKNIKAKAESYKSEMNAKSLVHPNIVRVLSMGEIDDYDNGYIVMEYVSGSNVQQIIDDPKETLCVSRRVSFALDISRALDFIHKNCLVHLDVKPANILVTPYDSCKLGDFGCCQVLEQGTGRVSPTQRSYLTGTFAYRAPELLQGKPPCTMADIFSLGVTLWQLESRRMPYKGQNQHVVIFGVVANHLRPNTFDTSDEEGLNDVDKLYREIYTQCWHASPDVRIPASVLIEKFTYCWKNTL